jgi:aerobic-type carbon monoxide dehydrogenase small subunit (CoxS/CutS family)
MKIKVNQQWAEVPDAMASEPLLWVLHDHLQLNGPRYGCGKGLCGCCSVLVDGKLARSCLMSVNDVGEKSVTTLEGLASGGAMHPVQKVFADNPLQCCYCVNGHILTAKALLERNPNPSPQEIDDAMSINLCRCGGYSTIRDNVAKAAMLLRGEPKR